MRPHTDDGIVRLGILCMLANQSSRAKLTTLNNDKMLLI